MCASIYLDAYTCAGLTGSVCEYRHPVSESHIQGNEEIAMAWMSVELALRQKQRIKCKVARKSYTQAADDLFRCDQQRLKDNITRDKLDILHNTTYPKAGTNTEKIAHINSIESETSAAETEHIRIFKLSIRDCLCQIRESGETFRDRLMRDSCSSNAQMAALVEAQLYDETQACSYFPAVATAIDELRLALERCRDVLADMTHETRARFTSQEDDQRTKLKILMTERDAKYKERRHNISAAAQH